MINQDRLSKLVEISRVLNTRPSHTMMGDKLLVSRSYLAIDIHDWSWQ